MQTETVNVTPNTAAAPRHVVIPSLDVLANPDGDVRIVVDLPGVAREGLQVAVDHGVLTIEATRADQPDRGYRRQLRVPDGVDVDAIEARIEHGVLTLSLPQAQRLRRRTIEVRG